MSSASTPTKKHVLLVTFPSYGHIIPVLELAKRVSQFHHVTFAVSAYKIPEIEARGELMVGASSVNFHGLPDGLKLDFDDSTDPEVLGTGLKCINSSFLKLMNDLPTYEHPQETSGLRPVDVVIVDSFFGVPIPTTVPYYLFSAANSRLWQFILSINDETPTASEAEVPFVRLSPPGGPVLPVQEMRRCYFYRFQKQRIWPRVLLSPRCGTLMQALCRK